MNILLLSMPDSFEHMPAAGVRMPNGALSSLAGNVDSHHQVAIADLILVQRRVRETLVRLVHQLKPDLVGLSIMTFQRKTAKAIIELIRALKPNAQIVVGGYDPTLATESYTGSGPSQVDFIVRGEGEITFRDLLRAIESGSPYDHIPGLSYRVGDHFVHNRERPISGLDKSEIRSPNRSARVLSGYTMLGRQIDVIETSRGCTFDCSFCSIVEMRGRNFETFSFDRVIADIQDAYDHGARSIFIVDDNITLNVKRFGGLCEAIIAAGLNSIDYSVQAMTSAIANHGERLAPLMRRAGFRYVFLGIENVVDADLEFLRARSKNTRRENGRGVGNAAIKAIEYIHQNRMYVIGGLIVGNPSDTRESIQANLLFAQRYIDWPYIQHPTPYPRTPMTKGLRERGLITSDRVEEYDGTTAVVACENLTGKEIEFLRWKVERWMRVRHLSALFSHDPLFVVLNFLRILTFNFRGISVRSVLGFEKETAVFERYRAIREAERVYV
jgi:anaerobic magnesium-protoporphyrin IX monomethyl ester cyclase